MRKEVPVKQADRLLKQTKAESIPGLNETMNIKSIKSWLTPCTLLIFVLTFSRQTAKKSGNKKHDSYSEWGLSTFFIIFLLINYFNLNSDVTDSDVNEDIHEKKDKLVLSFFIYITANIYQYIP